MKGFYAHEAFRLKKIQSLRSIEELRQPYIVKSSLDFNPVA